ncbi:hypothetical protein K435DRAFT_804091 [Dendrothele bispora CBS 962.96]|uniref:Uncharacterized protein n=1 Tax=Dendrothele bispora (strain CBS 962.96) TaxID=1314807 RepID=A0A4S8LFX2_DENBC|nr:hypothetical protein K435DRAFT_804091 [Dendrothele bispora CBS 962.96]
MSTFQLVTSLEIIFSFRYLFLCFRNRILSLLSVVRLNKNVAVENMNRLTQHGHHCAITPLFHLCMTVKTNILLLLCKITAFMRTLKCNLYMKMNITMLTIMTLGQHCWRIYSQKKPPPLNNFCTIAHKPYQEDIVQHHDLGQMDVECPECKALHWSVERNSKQQFGVCCDSGQVHLPLLSKPPQAMSSLYTSVGNPLAEKFRDNITQYNAAFAFTSLGVDVDTVYKSLWP